MPPNKEPDVNVGYEFGTACGVAAILMLNILLFNQVYEGFRANGIVLDSGWSTFFVTMVFLAEAAIFVRHRIRMRPP